MFHSSVRGIVVWKGKFIFIDMEIDKKWYYSSFLKLDSSTVQSWCDIIKHLNNGKWYVNISNIIAW